MAELRQAVDETAEASQSTGPTEDAKPETEPSSPATADVTVISEDSELAARLTTAATGAGLTCHVIAERPAVDAPDEAEAGLAIDAGSLVMVDAGGIDATSLAATIIDRVDPETPVAALVDSDDFDQRLELARAGVAAVIPRSQAPSIAMDFVAGTILANRRDPWRIIGLGEESELTTMFADDASPEPGHTLTCHQDPQSLWAALDGANPDLIVLIGAEDDDLIPDLCRVVRADPGLRHVALVAVGSLDGAALRVAIEAGLDDVISSDMPPTERRLRLERLLDRYGTDHSGSDLDRLTGLENRASVERSLDRLLRAASRRDEPFILVQLRVDRLDEIAREEGAVIGDLVLRRLAAAVKQIEQSGDVTGRWSTNELVIGISGVDRRAIEGRLGPVLDPLVGEQLTSPSGRVVHCEFRRHVAVAPDDGTTLASLDRTCQIAFSRGDDERVATGPEGVWFTSSANTVDVVVVEDDDSVADVISYALDLRGYRSRRFIDGEEAANALTGGEVAGRVVLLDVGLPSLDGFGVLRRLVSQGTLDASHVIMLTARSSEDERLRALELGATEHMSKPFSVPVLLGRLDQVLGGGRS